MAGSALEIHSSSDIDRGSQWLCGFGREASAEFTVGSEHLQRGEPPGPEAHQIAAVGRRTQISHL